MLTSKAVVILGIFGTIEQYISDSTTVRSAWCGASLKLRFLGCSEGKFLEILTR